MGLAIGTEIEGETNIPFLSMVTKKGWQCHKLNRKICSRN